MPFHDTLESSGKPFKPPLGGIIDAAGFVDDNEDARWCSGGGSLTDVVGLSRNGDEVVSFRFVYPNLPFTDLLVDLSFWANDWERFLVLGEGVSWPTWTPTAERNLLKYSNIKQI